MAIKTADWVVVETTTSGKGTISLGPAVQGYTSFTASFGESTDVYYSIISGNGNRECGVGSFNKSNNTLTRSNVTATIQNGVLLKDKQPIALSGKSTVACTVNSSTIDDIIAAIGTGGGGGGGNVQQPTISVGLVQTGLPGTLAKVENSGNNINAVFDFVIPEGEKGEPGTGGSGSSGKYLGLASTTTVLTPPFYVGDFYATSTPGTYANFGNIVVGSELAFLRYNGTAWVKDTVYVAQGVARSGITLGKVTSGWIHVKSVTTTSGTTVFVYEIGANTTIEFTSSSSTSLYSTSTIVLNANNNGTSVEYNQSTTNPLGTGKAAIAIDLSTNQPVILSGAVSTSERLCLLSYQAASAVNSQRSILPSNHFFSVSGSNQQNPDTTQTTFHVAHYGATTFTDAVDNSAALYYCKWAAQVVNAWRKKLVHPLTNTVLQFADWTPPEIDIVFPTGTFLANFSTTKYAGSGVYAYGYWTGFEGVRLVGTGIDKTIIKHSGGAWTLTLWQARSLTLHGIQLTQAPYGGTTMEEASFTDVKFYIAAEHVTGPSSYLTSAVTKVKRTHYKNCVFDYRTKIYTAITISGYDFVLIEGCVFNPTKIGFATHSVYVANPKSKYSRFIFRDNRIYRGVTGVFTRMQLNYSPVVGTVYENNVIEDVIEEGYAIDGIGDSINTPVVANGIITSVTRPAVCPGEKQWLRWRSISPNTVGAWSDPVCLTDTPTTTAYAFKASATQPSTPTGTALVPSGWSSTIPISEDPVWMSTAPVSGSLAGTWTAPVNITEIRVFQKRTTTPTLPTEYFNYPGGAWLAYAPALPHTDVWMTKTQSVDGNVRGLTKSWSAPVKIDSTPEEATFVQYRVATGYGDPPIDYSETLNALYGGTQQDVNMSTKYKPWRPSPRRHNIVLGATWTRVLAKDQPPTAIQITADAANYFCTLDDDSGREGTVCDILYADPVSQTLTLDLEAREDSILLNGQCGIHTGAFDCVIRGNRAERTTTGISAFINCFGFLIEGNTILNCYHGLRLTGQNSFGGNRCRSHNNVVRGNTFIGQTEEHNAAEVEGFLLDATNDFASDPDFRLFNNSFTDNTFIGGRIKLAFQGNMTWANNRLVDVTSITRAHCRTELPPASSAMAGQVRTRIVDDRDVLFAHAIPVSAMVPWVTGSPTNVAYQPYKIGTTHWATLFSALSGAAKPAFNQGYAYDGTPLEDWGTGLVMPTSLSSASQMQPGGTYSINFAGNTDWVALGAANNSVNTIFTYNGFIPASWGTGQPRPRILGNPTSITYHVCKLVNGVYSWVEI